MDTLYVRFGGDNHHLKFAAWSRNLTSNELAIAFDDSTVVLSPDDTRHSLVGCTWVSWDGKHLSLASGKEHILVFTIQSRSKKHLNTSYVNVDVDVNAPAPASDSVGGLIGWTSIKRPVLSTAKDMSWFLVKAPKEDDFVTSGLDALDAKTNKFQAAILPCSLQSQRD